MKRYMTKAIYKIEKTFKGMIELHQKEIANHGYLIKVFRERAAETTDHQEKMICLLESYRNRDHQKGHKTMVDIFKYLEKNVV